MTNTAQLIGIARKARSGAPMELLERATVSTVLGVEGDYRGKLRRRQVTLLAEEDWHAATSQIDRRDLPWTARRANLLVRGIRFPRETGHKLRIGTVIFQITGETDPCNLMDEMAPGLKDALCPDWRGGVTCRVIQDGQLELGDPVTLA